ncbi:hypothetical protein LTR27_001857 [Elasticomyces elasticus]|nr:hypothetical protein LTR27_001857 [Elasticomyces elasticus]
MSSQRDFSLFSLFTAGLACLVPFTTAYTKPVGSEPEGNPIYQPGLNSIVPAGENFTVTWDPTTDGTVTLVLLKGPAANAVPQYAIVEKIENSGSYVWTVSTDLAPGETGYGLQLIDDKTGAYQYTTQFGVSNPDYNPAKVSSTSSKWATASASATKSALISHYASITKSASASATVTHTVVANGTTTAGNHTIPITSTIVASTGGLPANGSVVYPTGSMTVPSSLIVSATGGGASATGSSTAPIQANSASGMATSFVGLVVAAGVAVLVL